MILHIMPETLSKDLLNSTCSERIILGEICSAVVFMEPGIPCLSLSSVSSQRSSPAVFWESLQDILEEK